MPITLRNFKPETYKFFDIFEPLVPYRYSCKCPVCKKVLREPLQLGCGHRICMPCFEKLPVISDKKRKLCPIDTEPITEVFSDRSALLEIMKIEVYCIFKRQGCDWTGIIFEFYDHWCNCKYTVACKVCEFSIINCNKKGKEHVIKQHYTDDVSYHLELLSLAENNIGTKLKTAEISTETYCDQIKEIGQRLHIDSDSMVASKALTESISSNLENVKSELTSVMNVSEKLMKRINVVPNKPTPTTVYSNIQEVREALRVLDIKIQERDRKLTNINSIEGRNQNRLSISTSSTDKIRKLEKEVKNAQETLTELDLKTRLFQATTTDGRYIWKIDNFLRRLREAREEKIVELFSPPLFTDIFGYRVCCKLFLNGNPKEKDGFGTHVAFYVIIMRGDYDRLLTFPFSRRFQVTLLAHNPQMNITDSIEPNPTHPGFQRPKEEMNTPVGSSKFVSHSALAGTDYLWDDALYFKIIFTH